ncbi:MAG TPA: YceI family protein [Flavipsychrobacter sp.]|nr:YceI family protein [Flavipsychrobacter sp.]
MKKVLLSLMAISLSTLMAFSQTKWTQTSANVSFTIKNRGSDVTGHFGGIATSLVFSPDKLGSSSLKGSLNVGTINTGIDKRNKDLQGENYFDAAKYKTIQMSSTKFAKKGAQYIGTFNVTIKGKTKAIEVPFTFIENGNTAEFKGTFPINRRDFGVGGKGGLAMFMSDNANVTIDIKAKK